MIDNLNGLFEVMKSTNVSRFRAVTSEGGLAIETRQLINFTDELFCSKCGAVRRCDVTPIYTVELKRDVDSMMIELQNLPCLLKARCLQCESETLLLVYKGPEKVELAVLHNTYSGCVTPNTPKEVKYYIDQAYRSRSVGAVSAAMAMYRSALEWLLYEQGFKEGMLKQKIDKLEAAIKNGKAPKWAMEIKTDFLNAIKDIGNGAMHTNGGDITKQNSIDKDLLELIDIVFAELLDKIYEQPIRSASNLDKLKAKMSVFK